MDQEISTYLSNHKAHLIGYAHLDPVWLWRWANGFSEVVATFRSALDRMNEFPDYIFTCPGACYYMWVEKYYPEMFEEIRQRVAQKRWIPVGGWWIQPDCNLAAGESYARQALYSQRYYLEKFGIICDTGYNSDSFGHSGMLPQILQKSGMKYYVFMRPGDHEKENVPPVFYWESPDGSRVLTSKIPIAYNINKVEYFVERFEATAKLGQTHNVDLPLYYGVGNHGGGPTISQLEEIERQRALYGLDRLIYSSPSQHLADVEGGDYPVVTDDLQIHAIGCYSTFLKIKKLNRLAENRLLAAEAFDTLAHTLLGTPLQTQRLESAWERVLFNHFHDIICGCSIRGAYDDAAESYGYALHEADDIRNAAIQRMAWATDTQAGGDWPVSKEQDWRLWGNKEKGTPAHVFNPLPFDVCIPVQFHGEFDGVLNDDSQPLTTQRVRGPMSNSDNDKFDTIIEAVIPAMGYETFWLHRRLYDPDYTEAGVVRETPAGAVMENDSIRVTIDKSTGLFELYDKTQGIAIMKNSANPLIIEEIHSDTWGHGLFEYRDVIGNFTATSMKVLENGSIRGRVRVYGRYNESIIATDFILYNNRPELEIKCNVNWREVHKMLKIEFQTTVKNANYRNEIPYGYMHRDTNGREWPIQRWVDIANEEHGVAIINSASWAADCKDGVIRMTALRSPMFADHFGARDEMCEPMDQGEHAFGYLIIPHGSNYDPAPKASAFNAEYPIIYGTYHKGKLPRQLAGINVAGDGVMVTAVKAAQDGNGFILRAHETAGKKSNVEFSIPSITRTWSAGFTPQEIKTFFLPVDVSKAVYEVNMLEL